MQEQTKNNYQYDNHTYNISATSNVVIILVHFLSRKKPLFGKKLCKNYAAFIDETRHILWTKVNKTHQLFRTILHSICKGRIIRDLLRGDKLKHILIHKDYFSPTLKFSVTQMMLRSPSCNPAEIIIEHKFSPAFYDECLKPVV